MILHSMRIEHPSKLGKLNGVGKIFLVFFDMPKYLLITTIDFMIDDVEVSWSFQLNGFKKFGFPHCLSLKLISKHIINYFIPNIQKTIIEHNKDWNNRVTYQTILETISFFLIYRKKLSCSPKYLSSVTLIRSNFQRTIFFHTISNQ